MKASPRSLHRAGALRHRLSLEVPIRTDDGGGGATIAWSPAAEVWAAIHPLVGSENIVGEAICGAVSHLAVIRFRPGVTPAMRFRLGGRILDIIAALDADERGRWLDCYCLEKNL